MPSEPLSSVWEAIFAPLRRTVNLDLRWCPDSWWHCPGSPPLPLPALGAQLPFPTLVAHPPLGLSEDSHPQLEVVPRGHLEAAEVAQLHT